MHIFIDMPDGKEIDVEAQPSDTIESALKNALAQAAIEPVAQRLARGAALLDNEKTLSACGVGNKSRLSLVTDASTHEKDQADFAEECQRTDNDIEIGDNDEGDDNEDDNEDNGTTLKIT